MREWLAIAAAVPGFIGFAVGRTDFWDPLVAWREQESDARAGGRARSRARYREFVDMFDSGQRTCRRRTSDRNVVSKEG